MPTRRARAIRGGQTTRRVARAAARRPASPPAWYRSRLAARRPAPCCDRPPTTAWSASNRRMVASANVAYFRWRGAWITSGVLARSVADCGLVLAAVAGHDAADPHSDAAQPAFAWDASAPLAHPRLGLVREALQHATPRLRDHTLTVARRFEAAGARIEEVSFGEPLELILAVHHVTMQTEVAGGALATARTVPGRAPAPFARLCGSRPPAARRRLHPCAALAAPHSTRHGAQPQRRRRAAAADGRRTSHRAARLPATRRSRHRSAWSASRA